MYGRLVDLEMRRVIFSYSYLFLPLSILGEGGGGGGGGAFPKSEGSQFPPPVT